MYKTPIIRPFWGFFYALKLLLWDPPSDHLREPTKMVHPTPKSLFLGLGLHLGLHLGLQKTPKKQVVKAYIYGFAYNQTPLFI
ncbi:hypothetical protein [Capnocytophaga sp. H2931]|uniref:hypothetical protein n=1 Tax=Capnocytophaga sp. H2931 TaxID=1945657 RepID=UPI000BB1E308|nr:hypothetical protein [Capnocytophaga sp. H2931]ATA75261.1 hypothetical protein CGC52_07440 [Capnocytophaga sp. H2931]